MNEREYLQNELDRLNHLAQIVAEERDGVLRQMEELAPVFEDFPAEGEQLFWYSQTNGRIFLSKMPSTILSSESAWLAKHIYFFAKEEDVFPPKPVDTSDLRIFAVSSGSMYSIREVASEKDAVFWASHNPGIIYFFGTVSEDLDGR